MKMKTTTRVKEPKNNYKGGAERKGKGAAGKKAKKYGKGGKVC